MTTKSKYRNRVLRFFNDATFEQPFDLTDYFNEEEFDGAGWTAAIGTAAAAGQRWGKKIVGAAPPTVAGDASTANGSVTAALTATSEKQEALLYWLDQRNLVMGQGLSFEARIKLPVLPTGNGKAVWGVAGAWADDPDTIANSAYFEQLAADAGLVKARVSDNSVVNAQSTGITVGTADWHIYRIEFFDLANIGFFVDGVQVGATAFAFGGNAAAQLVQPVFDVYKASGVGVGSLTVDYARWSQNRA